MVVELTLKEKVENWLLDQIGTPVNPRYGWKLLAHYKPDFNQVVVGFASNQRTSFLVRYKGHNKAFEVLYEDQEWFDDDVGNRPMALIPYEITNWRNIPEEIWR